MLLCCLLIFFQNQFLRKKFRNTIRVSNSLDLGPNCLQRLSTDHTRRQRVNHEISKKLTNCHLKESVKKTHKYIESIIEETQV